MSENKVTVIERRFALNTAEEQPDDDRNIGIIEGMPIVFNQPTVLRTEYGEELEEVILPTAIKPEAITRDCALFFNHDDSKLPLARVRTGRLSFTHQDEGIHMRAELDLNRQDCRDLYLAIKGGEIDKMSFAFRMEGFELDFSGDRPKRVITNIPYVYEVSAVTNPAYEQTSIKARGSRQVETERDAVETANKAFKEYKDNEQRQALALAKSKAKALMEL